MNSNILCSDLKNKTLKGMIYTSIVSTMVSAFLLNYSFMMLLECNLKIYTYIALAFMSTMLISIIVFVLTCIISIVVILFDNKFSMKHLYAITYKYISKTLLVTAFFTFLMIVLNIEINIFSLRLIANILNMIFIFQYYKGITFIANVNKLAAKSIVVLIILFNMFIEIYF